MENQKIFLLPGELCVSTEAVEICTLLGSCVSVCLYNKHHKFGGMNHYMTPDTPPGQKPSGKHGLHALDMLVKVMLAHDRNTSNLEATVLGGANVNNHLQIGKGIGAGNIIMAKSQLDTWGIHIVRRDIGGEFGRKIHFQNWTGQIEVKRIEKSQQTIYMEEKKTNIQQRGIKVLIVDDSPVVRDIIRQSLCTDESISVVGEAANPYEARELILTEDPDVICLDVIMPKMDGISFLRKLMVYKPIPVIIISTVVQEGSRLRKECEELGAVYIIDKEELDIYRGGIEAVAAKLIGMIKSAAGVQVKARERSKVPE